MKQKKFLFILTIAIAIYFISDFFFEDTMLYVLGAVIWGVFDVLFNVQLDSVGILIGVAILILFISLFYKTQNKFVKYFAIIVIIPLLYIVDFIRMELFTISITDVYTRYLKIAFSILSKSLILSVILYYGFYGKKKEIKTVE